MRSNPKRPGVIFINDADTVVAETVRIFRIVFEASPLSAFTVEFIDPFLRSNPQHAGAILMDGPDAIVAETVRIFRVVGKMSERLFFKNNFIQSAALSTNP